MKKSVLLTIALIASFGIISAQSDTSWIESAPGRYLPQMTRAVTGADSPCNTGGEAFRDFIPAFRKDKAFRNSRIRIDEESEFILQYIDFSVLKAVKKNTRCDKSYGTWYNVSANEVCFRFTDDMPCSEAGGGTFLARFQRIDGKWYLTDIMTIG